MGGKKREVVLRGYPRPAAEKASKVQVGPAEEYTELRREVPQNFYVGPDGEGRQFRVLVGLDLGARGEQNVLIVWSTKRKSDPPKMHVIKNLSGKVTGKLSSCPVCNRKPADWGGIPICLECGIVW